MSRIYNFAASFQMIYLGRGWEVKKGREIKEEKARRFQSDKGILKRVYFPLFLS